MEKPLLLYDEPDDPILEEPSKTPFPFLKLPAELRNRIYDYMDRDNSEACLAYFRALFAV
jgi:hypothetical protein